MFLHALFILVICFGPLPGWADTGVDAPEQWPQTTAQANRLGPQNDSPLHWASYEGQLALVRHLLDLGADVNARLKDGNTPLHLAAYQGQTEVAKLLLKHGAQLNTTNDRGLTPLDWALQRNQQRVARLLLNHDATASTSPADSTGVNTLSVLYLGGDTPERLDLSLAPSHADPIAKSATLGTSARGRPTASPPAPGRFSLQLGAVLDKTLAAGMWERMQRKCPAELRGQPLRLVEANLGGRLFHRLLVGQMSQEQARARCVALQHLGQNCLVVNSPR